MGSRTLSEVEVDKGLIWDSHFFGERLEIGQSRLINAKSNLAFEKSGIRIRPSVGEIVVLSHGLNLRR